MKYNSQEQLNYFLWVKGIETKKVIIYPRLQGKWANKAKKLIKELLVNDTGKES